VLLSTDSNLLVQLVVGGTALNTGYVSASDGDVDTAGFGIKRAGARAVSGNMHLYRTESGVWVSSHSIFADGASDVSFCGGGHRTGVGTVEGIRLQAVSGSFTAGSLVVSWR
jgi:hypothetical protein